MNSARSRPTPSTGSAATSSACSASARLTYSCVAAVSTARSGRRRRGGGRDEHRRRRRRPALGTCPDGAVHRDQLAVVQDASWRCASRRRKGCRARGSTIAAWHVIPPPSVTIAAARRSVGTQSGWSSARRAPRRRATRRPRRVAQHRTGPPDTGRGAEAGRALLPTAAASGGEAVEAPSSAGPGRAAAHRARRRTTPCPSARRSGPRSRWPPARPRGPPRQEHAPAACCGSSSTATSPSGPATILCDLTPMCSSSRRRGAFWTL